MSTRTQILVEGNESVKIYKHSDGYPSGVLPFLKELLPSFQLYRGFDDSYLTAHISALFIQEQKQSYLKELKKAKKEGNKSNIEYYSIPRFTGHGLDSSFHSDIEFLYVIKKDFSVSVFTPAQSFYDRQDANKSLSLADFKLERNITLEELKALNCPKYCNFDLKTLKEVKREKVTA